MIAALLLRIRSKSFLPKDLSLFLITCSKFHAQFMSQKLVFYYASLETFTHFLCFIFTAYNWLKQQRCCRLLGKGKMNTLCIKLLLCSCSFTSLHVFIVVYCFLPPTSPENSLQGKRRPCNINCNRKKERECVRRV